MRYFLLLSIGLCCYSCNTSSTDTASPTLATRTNYLSPDTTINRAIHHHYGNYYDDADLEFDFRDKHYTIRKQGGDFTYTRSFGDTTDIVTNEGFSRTVRGENLTVSEKKANAYANSVNSVRYFFMLPYGLNDPAVKKEQVGKTMIKGQHYHVVRVTFAEEGGGEDYDDVYYYYFHAREGRLDYLAYSFTVDGGGVRFREAINQRRVGGLLVQDYINYKPTTDAEVSELASLLETGGLKELSRIENENVVVR